MLEVRPQSRWVPLSWPSAWKDPKSFDWITGTPINCLVFEAGLPDLDPLRTEARRRELAIVDWTKPESSGIAAGEAAKIPWSGALPIAAITDAVWPGIRMSSTARRDAVDAGPTGAPWIDANGWLAQLARARAPEKTIWLVSKSQANRQRIVSENAYQLAVTDAWRLPTPRQVVHGGWCRSMINWCRISQPATRQPSPAGRNWWPLFASLRSAEPGPVASREPWSPSFPLSAAPTSFWPLKS